MPRYSILRWSILAMAAALAGGDPERWLSKSTRLHVLPSPGDTCLVDSSSDLSLMETVNAPATGEGDQQLPFTSRTREAYREKVLAVDQKGPSVIRRTYTVARTVNTDPFLKQTTKVSPLQGKTVTIRRDGNKVTVTLEHGKLSAEDESNVASDMLRAEAGYFPDRDLSPGDEWPIDPQLMFPLFPGLRNGEARYRFEKVVPHGGHPCAQIHVTIAFTGEPPGAGMPVTYHLSGELYRALDLKRTVAEEESGPVTAQGQSQRQGQAMQISTQGTMRSTESHRWLQVDGKPVKASG